MSFYKRLEEIDNLRMDFVSGVDIPVCCVRFDDCAKERFEELVAIDERHERRMWQIASDYGELLY